MNGRLLLSVAAALTARRADVTIMKTGMVGMASVILGLGVSVFAGDCPATDAKAPARKIKVACIGDSITWGTAMTNRVAECYPAQLQRLLGEGYEVLNCGDPGSCAYFEPKPTPGEWCPHSWYRGAQARKAAHSG